VSAPRQRKPRLAAPLIYKRPEQTYFAVVGGTAEERLATLRATLREAEEKIETAYDAVERGTAVDTLLHLIGHDLLCDAMRPEVMGADGAPSPNRADLDEAYMALFPVLASLEGAMALSMGTVINSTLVDAYSLLDWAQNECDGAALGKLLPEFDQNQAFNRGRDLAIEMLKEGQRQYAKDAANAQRMYRVIKAGAVAPAQVDFVHGYLCKVESDSTLSCGFSRVLSSALSEQPTDDPEGYRVRMAEFLAGKPGDDGTEPINADNAVGTAASASGLNSPPNCLDTASPDVTNEPSPSQLAGSAQGHYLHALALLETMATSLEANLVYAARLLARKGDADMANAVVSGDPTELNQASADMSVLLEVLATAANGMEMPASSALWGVHCIFELSKAALDDHIDAVERAQQHLN
jgi:hypothetical protein